MSDEKAIESIKANVQALCERIIDSYKPDIERAEARGDTVRLAEIHWQMRKQVELARQPLVDLARLIPPTPMIVPVPNPAAPPVE